MQIHPKGINSGNSLRSSNQRAVQLETRWLWRLTNPVVVEHRSRACTEGKVAVEDACTTSALVLVN